MSDYSFLDRTLTIRPAFLELVEGDHRTALLLSQAVYWQQRTDDEWWYKTGDEWERETYIPPRDQRRCRETLREFDWWHEETRGMPAKVHYRVDLEALEAAVIRAARDGKPGTQIEVEQPPPGEGADQGGASADQGGASADLTGECAGGGSHNAPARSETTSETTKQETTIEEREHDRDAREGDESPDHNGTRWATEYDLEPVDDGDRLDPMQLQAEWHRITNSSLDVKGEEGRADEVADICRYFDAETIRECIRESRHVRHPSRWGYFAINLDARATETPYTPEEFRAQWSEAIGKDFPPEQTSRIVWILGHSKLEIDYALGRTHRDADRPGWSYFRSVLETVEREGIPDEEL